MKDTVLDRPLRGVRAQGSLSRRPAPEQIAAWLRQVGGPSTVQELGLSAEELAEAATYGHYLRDRFTVRKLLHYLGLDAVAVG